MFVSTRSIVRAALPALLFFGIAGTSGCGEIDGGQQPFAGTVRYQDPGGEFELRLLEPPWIPLTLGGMTVFVVPPDNLSITSNEEDALYSMHVDPVEGDALGALAVAARAAAPPWDLLHQRTVHAVSGAAGAEVSWQQGPASFHREVFLGAPASPTFHLHISAKKPIADDPMITQMILSFAPRGTLIPTGVGR